MGKPLILNASGNAVESDSIEVDSLTVDGSSLAPEIVGAFKFGIFSIASIPSGYLPLIGETIGNAGSGADYAGAEYEDLFDLVKLTEDNLGTEVFGSGDTVELPDARDRFFRAAGASRDAGTYQDDAMQRMVGQFNAVNGSPRMDVSDVSGFESQNPFSGQGTSSWRQAVHAATGDFANIRFDNADAARTADENRPTNFAVNVLIRY